MDARKLTRRKTPLLAYSEYVSTDPDNSNQVWGARLELIEAVKRVIPQFLKALSDDVFPLYEALAKAGYDFDRILYSSAGSRYEALSEDGGLKQALSEWAARFNANHPWLMDEALHALRSWCVAPESRKSLEWSSFHPSSRSGATGETFEFSFMPWETELFTWPRYRQLLRKKFEEKLSEYEKQTRGLAESCGLVRARRTYSPHNFDWFVLYQFAGLSSTKIADKWSLKYQAGIDVSTVLKGIKTVATLIGWDQTENPSKKPEPESPIAPQLS
jgi:hypothetical protein